MPPAGGIAAPVLTALKGPVSGKPAHCIDSATYIEMACDSSNCHIFFNTDGTRPNPEQRKVNGREVTFKYRAPFCLKPGKRVVKAVAMHRVTRQLSAVTTRTYHCEDIHGWNETDDCYDDCSVTTDSTAWDSDLEDGLRTRKGASGGGSRRRAWDKAAPPKPAEPSPLDELGIPPDQGFAAVNHSGTQINLYGGGPPGAGTGGGGFGGPAGGLMGWEVRTPNNVNFRGGFAPQVQQQQPQPALPAPDQGVTPQQLNLIAAQLSQRMDETRQSTLQDIRRLVEDKKKQQPPQPPQQPVSADPACLPVSKGDGDFKKQLQHVYAHLLQYARSDGDFQAAVGGPKFGKVISAELDESTDSYLLTVQIGKPGYKKPLSEPKVQPPPKPKQPPAKKAPTPPPPRRRNPTPPPNHKMETEVKQTSHEKADAIKLKAPEEQPPEPVDEAYFQQEEYVQEGTLKPYDSFNANADAEQLRKAMKGLGTNEESIINVLGHRTVSQRQEIVRAFKMKYGKDLKADLDSELSGNFNKICQNLCLGAAEYDAMELRAAMKGLGTDEDCLIEVICTRTQAQVQEVKKIYHNMYNRDLEEDVMSETSGHFKRILVSLLTGARPEGSSFDPVQAKKDAQALQEAGIGKWGTDESKFNEILCGNNNAHLRAVFAEYESLTGKTLEDSLKSEMSGDLLKAMLTLIRCVQNKPAYFAKALQKSMKGLGTDDRTLLRIIISRCEVDMVQIKDAFQKEFGQSLAQWIKDDTSGDYCKILLALIGEN
ncbi:hypothetical protein BOX15_Mlig011209g4 [Macrostomum lignano]|uniref:Annexin n=2 Tax=Macrostomum lignano TaxID=282301 RepID=A0A267EJ83_9PLAT|nr:hypothetical protein BOX15_Mlig011209g4 [Macrostomum lignano]